MNLPTPCPNPILHQENDISILEATDFIEQEASKVFSFINEKFGETLGKHLRHRMM
ncbi:hypothetical protein MKY37_21345 [Psychrobacillus sp. FSL K6-2836]|uniref:hypothetical protein n=1 Tax=Psychrobacillus sp. FSL K6-2836 TaxID=2921548 RepID=UPI0030FAE3D1